MITYSVDEDGQPLDFNAGSAYLAGGYVAQLIVYGPHNIPWRQLSSGECRATIVVAMEALYQQLNNDMSRMISAFFVRGMRERLLIYLPAERMVDAKSLRHAEQADAVWGLHNV